jgi:hypothetical protein
MATWRLPMSRCRMKRGRLGEIAALTQYLAGLRPVQPPVDVAITVNLTGDQNLGRRTGQASLILHPAQPTDPTGRCALSAGVCGPAH